MTADIALLEAREQALAEAFIRTVYSNAQGAAVSDPDEATFSFSFRLGVDSPLVSERKNALRAVVAERNKLVHKWIASFDCASINDKKRIIWRQRSFWRN